MISHLERIRSRYDELGRLLSDPEVFKDQTRFKTLAKERSDLERLLSAFEEFEKVEKDIEEAKRILDEDSDDPELQQMARDELAQLEARRSELEREIKVMLLPRDPMDERNILMEIRAGAGGDEAGLFAADLLRMYQRYAELRRWKTELISGHANDLGGFKEVIMEVSGDGVYSRLKYESGVHRVQRIPVTESGGRIHTSTVTVAVLPEAEEVDIHIDPNDLRIDVYRSSGCGGQSVNTTDSAVRITHLPSGLVVTCQDEKSQHKNKTRAMKILRSRLLEEELRKAHDARAADRRSQIGTGDRSERIRTYNFPQGRVTDHRIGLSLYKLPRILEGELDEVLEALARADQEARLAALEKDGPAEPDTSGGSGGDK